MEIFPFSECFNDHLRSRGSLKPYFMYLKGIYFRGKSFFCGWPKQFFSRNLISRMRDFWLIFAGINFLDRKILRLFLGILFVE